MAQILDTYITGVGGFLPGSAVGVGRMEAHLGRVAGRDSLVGRRALRWNGIETRHYAIDDHGEVTHSNAGMCAEAVIRALDDARLQRSDLSFLATATTQGDLLVPGHAAAVHGELGGGPLEIASFQSVCGSSLMAAKSAFMAVRTGEHAVAAACAGEFSSRWFQPAFYDGTALVDAKGRLRAEADYLRFTLSDGAGAVVMEPAARQDGLSLKVKFIDLVSLADAYDPCMWAGAPVEARTEPAASWSHLGPVAAHAAGALALLQDFALLKRVIRAWVGVYMQKVEASRIRPRRDRPPALPLFRPLVARGDRLAARQDRRDDPGGEMVLQPVNRRQCRVGLDLADAGRVLARRAAEGGREGAVRGAGERSGVRRLHASGGGMTRVAPGEGHDVADVLRRLTIVFTAFEARLEASPLIRKLTRGRFTLGDYRAFLINLRQQVKDGALWMSRAASHVDESHLELRSILMRHAVVEHRDFRLLEADYVAAGGRLDDIRGAEKNVGSEALSAWMFHQASQPNPFGLLGAMWIIEGLGAIKAAEWGQMVQGPARSSGRGRAFPALPRGERRRAYQGVRDDAQPRAARQGNGGPHRQVRRGDGAALRASDRGDRPLSPRLGAAYDPRDPDPWLALELDQSLPILPVAKHALISGNRSWSRRWMFPIVRPAVFIFFGLVKLVRGIFPHYPNLNGALHKVIHWGLKRFCTPQACTLILRHFHIGTELLAFIKANAGPVEVETVSLRPRTLKALEDNVFLQHDLNIYNFIIQLNQSLRAQGRDLRPVETPDFSMISDGDFDLEPLPNGRLNFVDVQTAIEFYTPFYALCLPRADFVRAANSLQLDETIAIYIAKILGTDYHMSFVKNGHPLVQLSTLQAGYRLMMHGLDVESLYGWLRYLKGQQRAGLPVDPRIPAG